MTLVRAWLAVVAVLLFLLVLDRWGVPLPVSTRVRGYAAMQDVQVSHVLDGARVRLSDGRHIVLSGIAAPSPEHPGAALSAAALAYWLGRAAAVTLEVCPEQLGAEADSSEGYLTVDGVDIHAVLLSEGLVRASARPPCGRERADSYAMLQVEAMRRSAGLWAAAPSISACEGALWDRRWVRLYGTVSGVKVTDDDVRVELGSTRSCARAIVTQRVLWSGAEGRGDSYLRWADAQSDAYLVGRSVEVIGELRREGRRVEMQVTHPNALVFAPAGG